MQSLPIVKSIVLKGKQKTDSVTSNCHKQSTLIPNLLLKVFHAGLSQITPLEQRQQEQMI
jgi:hypothetical protein